VTWALITGLLMLWFIGLIGQFGGVLIWVPLAIAAMLVMRHLLSGRRTV
jgi:hypothetical protein